MSLLLSKKSLKLNLRSKSKSRSIKLAIEMQNQLVQVQENLHKMQINLYNTNMKNKFLSRQKIVEMTKMSRRIETNVERIKVSEINVENYSVRYLLLILLYICCFNCYCCNCDSGFVRSLYKSSNDNITTANDYITKNFFVTNIKSKSNEDIQFKNFNVINNDNNNANQQQLNGQQGLKSLNKISYQQVQQYQNQNQNKWSSSSLSPDIPLSIISNHPRLVMLRKLSPDDSTKSIQQQYNPTQLTNEHNVQQQQQQFSRQQQNFNFNQHQRQSQSQFPRQQQQQQQINQHQIQLRHLSNLPRPNQLNLKSISDLAMGNSANININNNICDIFKSSSNSRVDCRDKQLQRVPNDLPENIVSLDISMNKLNEIDVNTLGQYKKLRIVRCRSNLISTIGDGAFVKQPQLQVLLLDRNQLIEFNGRWLFGLSQLKRLSLNHNKIRHINGSHWHYVKNLLNLSLANNELEQINSWYFTDILRLQELRLNNNKISTIQPNSFLSLKTLRVLELRHNRLKIALQSTGSIFNGLSQLQRLDLSSNDLDSIRSDTFDGLTQLQVLIMNDNPIRSLPELAFEQLIQPINFNLNSTATASASVTRSGGSLQEFHMDSEELICDCTMSWLAQLYQYQQQNLATNSNVQIISGFGDARCQYPALLARVRLSQIEESQMWRFTCDGGPAKPELLHPVPEMQTTFVKGRQSSLKCSVAIDRQLRGQTQFMWLRNGKTIYTSNTNNNINNNNNHESSSSSLIDNDDLSSSATTIISNDDNVNVNGNGNGNGNVNENDNTNDNSNRNDNDNMDRRKRRHNSHNIQKRSTYQFNLDEDQQHQHQQFSIIDQQQQQQQRYYLTSTMRFSNITQFDSGDYQCAISNPYGDVYSGLTHVQVYELPHFTSRWQRDQRLIIAQVGRSINLTCEAGGDPQPNITWKFSGPIQNSNQNSYSYSNSNAIDLTSPTLTNGLSLSNLDLVQQQQSGILLASSRPMPAALERRMNLIEVGDKKVMSIKRVTFDDEGVYTCEARNDYGAITVNFTLQVVPNPIHNQQSSTTTNTITKSSSSSSLITNQQTIQQQQQVQYQYQIQQQQQQQKTCIIGESIQFECPRGFWYKDGQIISGRVQRDFSANLRSLAPPRAPTVHVHVNHISQRLGSNNQAAILEIPKCQLIHTGTYQCSSNVKISNQDNNNTTTTTISDYSIQLLVLTSARAASLLMERQRAVRQAAAAAAAAAAASSINSSNSLALLFPTQLLSSATNGHPTDIVMIIVVCITLMVAIVLIGSLITMTTIGFIRGWNNGFKLSNFFSSSSSSSCATSTTSSTCSERRSCLLSSSNIIISKPSILIGRQLYNNHNHHHLSVDTSSSTDTLSAS